MNREKRGLDDETMSCYNHVSVQCKKLGAKVPTAVISGYCVGVGGTSVNEAKSNANCPRYTSIQLYNYTSIQLQTSTTLQGVGTRIPDRWQIPVSGSRIPPLL